MTFMPESKFKIPQALCSIRGEPLPEGELMFKFHGYSGPCPKPPLLTTSQRAVTEEKRLLDEKLSRLMVFFGTEDFGMLDDAEIERLLRQSEHMQAYSTVLGERIAVFM